MSVGKRNAEGYFDPTAYEALTRIWEVEKTKTFRPLVFICSPYAGDTETSIKNAQRFCRFAVEQNRIPIAPHLLFPQFLDDTDEEERGLGLFFSAVLLGKCVELWVFSQEATAGMTAEIAKAKRRCMPVRYFNTDCKEVSQP
jgi:hypothetical protein